jgi:2-methylfumaryl-CoA isomerase
MDSTEPTPILAGLRLVEAAAFVAAPLGGMTLAQLGADVIRIDAIGGGLDHRRWPIAADGTSLFWCGLNKAKRSVALDLASAEGRELATAIVCAPGENAGLFLTNFPPRGWLAHETLRARRADLIQLTIQGERNGGSAVDYTVNARLGVPYVTGEGAPDDVVNHVLPAWDLVTGQMAATGVLAAERHRRLHGSGQHVMLALEDMALAVMGHLGFIAEAALGARRERHGNFLFGAFGKDFVTADGVRVMVVALTLKQWRSLCAATSSAAALASLATRRGLDLDREGDRFMAKEAIAEIVGGWIAARPFTAVQQAFDAHAVCWERYQPIDRLVREDPACSTANPLFSEVEQPGVGRWAVP